MNAMRAVPQVQVVRGLAGGRDRLRRGRARGGLTARLVALGRVVAHAARKALSAISANRPAARTARAETRRR